MSENKPSAGAMRAAEKIHERIYGYKNYLSDREIAVIIDRYTARKSHVDVFINKTETDNATVSDPVTAWAKLRAAMTAMKGAAGALDAALDHAIAAVKEMEPK